MEQIFEVIGLGFIFGFGFSFSWHLVALVFE